MREFWHGTGCARRSPGDPPGGGGRPQALRVARHSAGRRDIAGEVPDRDMRGVDPWESEDEICPWFDACPISETDRRKLGRTNAQQLFGLKQPAAMTSSSALAVRLGQAPRA
jgi:hypothetical protein